jgi:hypothetical protein
VLDLEGNKYLFDCLMNSLSYDIESYALSFVLLVKFFLEIEVPDIGNLDSLGVVHDSEVSLISGERALVHLEFVIAMSCVELIVYVQI